MGAGPGWLLLLCLIPFMIQTFLTATGDIGVWIMV